MSEGAELKLAAKRMRVGLLRHSRRMGGPCPPQPEFDTLDFFSALLKQT